MRLLDGAGIVYKPVEYPVDEADLSALHAVASTGLSAEQVFKTLVLKGASGLHYVMCISAVAELNLKKAAAAAGEKSINMIPVKDLLALTGYMRGGCSPIGMKKDFPVFMDETCFLFDTVSISAGKRGVLALLAPQDLITVTGAVSANLID
jgi:Cys-tRNA(Pro)/Cys-tRNA(Cys) deacylase